MKKFTTDDFGEFFQILFTFVHGMLSIVGAIAIVAFIVNNTGEREIPQSLQETEPSNTVSIQTKTEYVYTDIEVSRCWNCGGKIYSPEDNFGLCGICDDDWLTTCEICGETIICQASEEWLYPYYFCSDCTNKIFRDVNIAKAYWRFWMDDDEVNPADFLE